MPSPWSKAARAAVEHMVSDGELRIVVGIGTFCQNPPKVGSGVIVSSLGRLEVSARIVRQLRTLGLQRHYKSLGTKPVNAWDDTVDDTDRRRGYQEVADIWESAGAALPLLRAIADGRDIIVI